MPWARVAPYLIRVPAAHTGNRETGDGREVLFLSLFFHSFIVVIIEGLLEINYHPTL